MKPALTAEEWERVLAMPAPLAGVRLAKLLWQGAPVVESEPSQRLHALAAVALYGQPFGFTHGDLRMLRQSIIALQTDAAAFEVDNSKYIEALSWLAYRIETLLPPAK